MENKIILFFSLFKACKDTKKGGVITSLHLVICLFKESDSSFFDSCFFTC